MQTPDALRTELTTISGRDYPAYRSLLGAYDFGHFILEIDHIQKDPFAAPTRARLRVSQRIAKFPAPFLASEAGRRATADWIVRRAAAVIEATPESTKRKGALSVDAGGQHVLRRTAAVVDGESVELRLNIALPGEGRTVLAEEAERLLFHAIPTLCREALLFDGRTSDQLRRHVEAVEDQVHLRAALADLGLVAFIGNGAVLPRESANSSLPMDSERAVPVTAPRDLRVTLDLPHAGKVSGVGIPVGVTLIVGGGFHGKSTLLHAIQEGVYDHVPGDGRELVVTDPTAMRIAAEQGRYATGLDLRTFFRPLPDGSDLSAYSTDSAPACISQAANLLEALEMGSKVLLVDEDECAIDFMTRDARMQALVGSRREPIIPLVDRVRLLRELLGVSTVIAVSGLGDYLAVADTVIMMDKFAVRAVTKQAAEVVEAHPSARQAEKPVKRLTLRDRAPQPSTVNAHRGRKAAKVGARGMSTINFGRHEIDVSRITGIVDPSQVRAIGDALEYAVRNGILDGRRSLREVAEAVARAIVEEGLDRISPHFGRHPGDYAEFRPMEFAAALCRLRTVSVDASQAGDEGAEAEIEAEATPPPAVALEETPATEGETRTSRRRRRGRRSRRSGRGEAEATSRAPEEEAGPQPEPEPEPAADPEPDGEDEPEDVAQAPAEAGKPRSRRRRGRRSHRTDRADAGTVGTADPEPVSEPQPGPEPEPEEPGETVQALPQREKAPARGRRRRPPATEAQEPRTTEAQEPPATEAQEPPATEAQEPPTAEAQERPASEAQEPRAAPKARRIARRTVDPASPPLAAEPTPEPEPSVEIGGPSEPAQAKPTARRLPRRPVVVDPPPVSPAPPKPAATEKTTRKATRKGATEKGAATKKSTATKSTRKAAAKPKAPKAGESGG